MHRRRHNIPRKISVAVAPVEGEDVILIDEDLLNRYGLTSRVACFPPGRKYIQVFNSDGSQAGLSEKLMTGLSEKVFLTYITATVLERNNTYIRLENRCHYSYEKGEVHR